MLSITNAVRKVLNQRFEDMMTKERAFPAVNFSNDGRFKSYNLMEYSTTWATFAKVADARVKEKLDPKLGTFSRKRSQAFLTELKTIADGITEMDVMNSRDRFKTWADGFM